MQIHDAVAGNVDNLHLVGGFEAAGIGRRDVFDHVDIARKHGGNTGARVLEDAEGDLVPLGLFAPIGIIFLNYDVIIRRPRDELERPGADDALAGVHLTGRELFHLGRQDGDTAEVVQEQRRRAGGLDAHRQRIDGRDFGDRLHIGGKRARAVGGRKRNALDAGDHVFSGEIAAVVEFHAFAQFEFPGRVINDLPGDCQRRLDLLLVVLIDKAVENIARHRAIGADDIELRIHGCRRGGKTDGQVLCLACERHGRNRRDQCGCEHRKLHGEDSSGLSNLRTLPAGWR
ncbi:hypothetical protein D3C73_672050 [compost metagenome]